MAKMFYAKVPFDWESEPRYMDYFDRHGYGDYRYLHRLFLALYASGGSVDFQGNNGHRRSLIRRLSADEKEKPQKWVEGFLSRCADCGIIDKVSWMEHGMVSDRIISEDVTARRNQTRKARDAAAARAVERELSRKLAKDAVTESVTASVTCSVTDSVDRIAAPSANSIEE